MEKFTESPPNIHEILLWSQNKLINLRTNRKIKVEGKVYTLLKKNI